MKISKAHLFLAALLILLLISPVISCGQSYTKADLDAASNNGYMLGYKIGKSLGEATGFDRGKVACVAEWLETNERNAEIAYDNGYQAGKKEGYNQGYLDGVSTCKPYYWPTKAPILPEGCDRITAICCDGTYSYSKHRSGTCSHHGGVCKWINKPLD